MHNPASELEPRVLARLDLVEKAALTLMAGVAGVTLAFWCFPTLAALAPPGWSGMRVVTAGWMLVTVAALALSVPGRPPLARRVSVALSLALLALPVVVLASYTGLVPFHADRWPLRPWPQTALAFALVAMALPVINCTEGLLARIADLGTLCLLGFVLFLVGSYAFDVVEFLAVDRSSLTSPQILFCLIMLAFATGARRAAAVGPFAVLVGAGVGSRIARRVVPGAVIVPFAIFFVLHSLIEAGIVTPAEGRAIAAPMLTLATLAVVAWIASHTNALEQQLRGLSLTDGLTNVLNRRGFDTMAGYLVQTARRNRTPLTAFFFDLDGLKRANDGFGHNAGSLLIRCFADLLMTTFRKSDLIARVGGDEFVVLAAASTASMEGVLERLDRSIDQCNASGIIPSPISYSVGYAELVPDGDSSVEQVVAAADARMYAEKLRKRAA